MAKSRSEIVAEILWELKQADKLATFTSIARRAGFSPGSQRQTMTNCLKAVRQNWPHLQWWRALRDDARVVEGSEQEGSLRDAGFQLEKITDPNGTLILKNLDQHLVEWSRIDDRGDGNDTDSPITVLFDDTGFTEEEMLLFLTYLSESYREIGGYGLQIVRGDAMSIELEGVTT